MLSETQDANRSSKRYPFQSLTYATQLTAAHESCIHSIDIVTHTTAWLHLHVRPNLTPKIVIRNKQTMLLYVRITVFNNFLS